MTYTTGIDVSTYQDASTTPQRIDWAQPALHGVKFVINRATFCASVDDDFAYNWAQQRGRYIRGAYGFWGYWAGAPAIDLQVKALVNILKPDPGEMPVIWADVEKANSSYDELPSHDAALASLERYMKGIEDGLGKGTGIYTNIAGILRLTPVPQWLRDKPLWVAWPLSPITGETVEEFIERTKVTPPIKEWTGFKVWQYDWKGPGMDMGMESYGLDMDYFNGSENDLRAWCEQDESEETNMWTDNAIGLYTKTAGWTNPAWNFIVGYAGGDWTQRSANDWVLEPNPNLKAIEEQAHKEGKPFIALWDFDVSDYSLNQIDAREDRWRSEAEDYPLQALIGALQNRDVDGLIIRVMNRKNREGKDEMLPYVAFAAKMFVQRAHKWLYQNKGARQWTFVLTSDDFMRQEGAQEYFYSWLKDWYLGIEQKAALLPLASGAWPQANDKIKAVPPSLGWKFWYHYDTAALDMMIFNGKPADLRGFLGYGVTPPPDTGGGDQGGGTTDGPLEVRVAALENELDALKILYRDHTHGKPTA